MGSALVLCAISVVLLSLWIFLHYGETSRRRSSEQKHYHLIRQKSVDRLARLFEEVPREG
jgi:hypothetical protein